jgi:hypothetical protein
MFDREKQENLDQSATVPRNSIDTENMQKAMEKQQSGAWNLL